MLPEGAWPAWRIKSVSWSGNQAIEVIFEDGGGRLDRKLAICDDEHQLEIVTAGRPWSFEGDGHLFRLVPEAYRLRLAWLFDPYVAITTSPVDPLPHQIQRGLRSNAQPADQSIELRPSQRFRPLQVAHQACRVGPADRRAAARWRWRP
jgi:hypothetical protein